MVATTSVELKVLRIIPLLTRVFLLIKEFHNHSDFVVTKAKTQQKLIIVFAHFQLIVDQGYNLVP